MKCSLQFFQASLESASGFASAETVVKILHPVAIPKSVGIWQSAAVDYEKEHPETKIQFDYPENEEFKAKLPTLLESNDRPSVFSVGVGSVVLEQIRAGLCQDITRAIAGNFRDLFYTAGVRSKELSEKAGVDPKQDPKQSGRP